MKRVLFLVALCAGTWSTQSTAMAATSGHVTGNINHYQNKWGACPHAVGHPDCAGWTYTDTEFQTQNPIPEVKVVIFDDLDNQIGSGVTNLNGDFDIYWYSSANRTAGYLEWYGEHMNNRFAVQTTTGGRWVFWSSERSLSNGASKSWGSLTWGSSTNPNRLANVYEGAWRTWYHALRYAGGSINTNFQDVSIRAWSSSTSGSCRTSCAGGKTVTLDDAATTYQRYSDRIAHEIGHIASEQSSQGQWRHACGATSAAFMRDGVAGWNLTSPEYTCASWEEGFATFIGDVSRVWNWAVDPTTCAANDCTLDLEASSGSSCPTGENRSALTSERFLWDIYDDTNDSESVGELYGEIIDNNRNWAVGTGNRQRDEPFDGTGSGANFQTAEGDGKSGFDFRWNYFNFKSTTVYSAWSNNCQIPGD